MIPKKIHYCWFGNTPLPKSVKKCLKSWKKYCKDYEIIEWNEKNFNIHCNKFVENAYKSKAWAFVSDYARLKIIYEEGGIYLDTDVEVVKNLDNLLNNKCYFGVQQCDKLVATGLGFGAEPKNATIRAMLKVYEEIDFDKKNKNEFLCPILNTNILLNYGYKYKDEIIHLNNNKITIYPPKYFDPIAPGDSKNLICDDTYSIHHYNASWTNKSNRLKRKVINFIGQDKINKLKKIIKK